MLTRLQKQNGVLIRQAGIHILQNRSVDEMQKARLFTVGNIQIKFIEHRLVIGVVLAVSFTHFQFMHYLK